MDPFRGLNIGPRLGLGFAVVLALLLVVAGAGMRGVSEVGSDLRATYEDRAMPIEQLSAINKLLLRNRILVMDMMAFPGEANLAKRDKELRANVEEVGKLWEIFTKTRMSAEVREIALAFIDLRKVHVTQPGDCSPSDQAKDPRQSPPGVAPSVRLPRQTDDPANRFQAVSEGGRVCRKICRRSILFEVYQANLDSADAAVQSAIAGARDGTGCAI